MAHICDFCDSDSAKEIFYTDEVHAGRRKLQLAGLKKTACMACEAEYVTPAQLNENQALLEAALREAPEAITVALLRTLRYRFGLSQRAASSLFGAGDSAFGKWESGSAPSGPTALLLQCAFHIPGVMDYLARLQGVRLPESPEAADWIAGGHVTGSTPVFSLVRRVEAPRIPPRTAYRYEPSEFEMINGIAA